VAIARSVVRKSGARTVSFLSGDFLYDAIGKGYDLIFISQVLHSCSAEEALRVIRKAGDALNAGGRVVVQEFSLENDRAHPVQSALFSVNMLVNTSNGRCYSSAEIRKWFSAAGLKDVRDMLMDDTVLVFGKKKA
jgi:SAM-dependent methyltransferase